MTADDTPAPGPVEDPVVLDERGQRCPLPVIHLARAARGAPSGRRFTVLATDPAARYDVPAWARMRGHTVVGTLARADEPVWEITVELA